MTTPSIEQRSSLPHQPAPLLVAPLPTYNTRLLCLVMIPALVYGIWLYWNNGITGSHFWDAVIGILLGIYICSRPVSNLLDMIYTQRIQMRHLKERAGMTWLLMNFLTTFVGWASIVLGAVQMVRYD